jgi:hypothetical protein
LAFSDKVKSELVINAMHREVEQAGGTDAPRESSEAFGSESVQEDDALTPENTIS